MEIEITTQTKNLLLNIGTIAVFSIMPIFGIVFIFMGIRFPQYPFWFLLGIVCFISNFILMSVYFGWIKLKIKPTKNGEGE